VGVMIDITERKQREDEIKSLNESLQQQTMEVVAANKNWRPLATHSPMICGPP